MQQLDKLNENMYMTFIYIMWTFIVGIVFYPFHII